MKAKIEIEFQIINGIKVDKSLLNKVPMLESSTKKTMEILCQQIEKYFAENKIKVKTEFKLEK